MTKAIPSKTHTEWIWCQECSVWYEEDSCTNHELLRVNNENSQFTSEYDGCEYYVPSDTSDVSVWQCPGGHWIWDPNDGDVNTPGRYSGVMYTCSDCETKHDEKGDADNCCWKEEDEDE